MTATTDALTSTTGYTYTRKSEAAGTDASGNTVTNQSEAQDRFLKLLVAQLNNQDPMNPLDNAQMTSQIAQINTVSGIAQLNDTMKSMSTQMSAMQVLQAGNLVGHSVLVEGDKLAVSADGKTGAGGFDLAGKASDVKVQVLTAGGRVIDTLSMGALEAGQHSFQVDASAYPGNADLRFQAVASNGTTAVTSTLLMQDKVMAVGSGTDGLTLTLQGNGVKSYSSVRSVL